MSFLNTSPKDILSMGGITVPERSSLDRLKALDDLPDLDTQLQEARSLCNHSSRAEMILRWLMGKLKASDEARTTATSWELMSSCIRLPSASRIASLLGSNGFVEVLQKTCSESDLTASSMHAIASSLDLLLELSKMETGAPIKSLLSVDGTTVASICGDWFRHVHKTYCNIADRATSLDISILRPGLSLWSFRKRSDADDELFNTNCLVPSMLLLRLLHEDLALTSKKRKRNQSELDARTAESALESMVAKHTVLPARTVFFKESKGQTRPSRGHRTGPSQPDIRERLGSLKMAILREQDQEIVRSIPLLLDIALRSVATPTPKHRFNERPWIETIMKALQGAFSGQERSVQNRVLAELLDVIHRQGHSLSLQTLTAIVKEDALPGEKYPRHPDWPLVTKIIKLDANVFCDRPVMEMLFTNLNESDYSESTGSDDPELGKILKEDIATPVMKAHAKSRTLSMFVDCWSEQLLKPDNMSLQLIWSELAPAFAEICEEAMTTEQIIALFDKKASDVNKWADPMKGSDEFEIHQELHANFTLLEALLSGVRNDATIAKLQGGLDTLYQSLQTIAHVKIAMFTETVSCELWTLLSRVFDLWFPSWAIQQSSRKEMVEKALNESFRGAFNAALAQCAPESESEDHLRQAQAAQMFVACTCTVFGAYEEFEQCRRLYTDGIERLSQQKDVALPVLLKFANVFVALQSDVRKALFNTLLTSSSEPGSSEASGEEVPPANLRALVSAASSTPDRAALNDIVAGLILHLNNEHVGQSQVELSLLSTLSAVDFGILTQEQRVKLLDALVGLQPPHPTNSGSVQLQQRLSLMIGLLRFPCRGARLLTNAECIWSIVGLFKGNGGSKNAVAKADSPLSSFENLEIFEELVQCAVGSLLTAQGQTATRDTLAKFSDLTKKRLEQQNERKKVDLGTRMASLILFKTVFGVVGKDDTKLSMVHQDPAAVTLYLKALVGELDSIVSESVNRLSLWAVAGDLKPLFWILDSVAAMPDVIPSSPARQNLAETAKMLAFVFLDSDDAEMPEETLDERSRIKVACFQVACKYAPTAGLKLLPLAEKLLHRNLTAKQHLVVLSTFESAFTADDDEWTVALQRSIQDEQAQSPAALMLQQRAIKSLTDEDLEGSQDGKGYLRGTESFTAFQIFDHILKEVSENSSVQGKRIALQTVVIILKEKPFMTNQYGIEQTLTTLHNLLEIYNHASSLYTDICAILTTLFAAHRSRLQGRFHLLIPVFQSLLTTLFTTTLPSPTTHARTLSRLLESFSNPNLRPRKSPTGTTTSLIDSSRKAQARAGQYAPYILHHYCAQILSSSSSSSSALREGVREALMPGLWVVIEAMESYNVEGVRSLSAAMNASERAVLRGVYEDWRRFGRWEGL